MSRIRTPCIGICSTTYGGDVCRGCRRFAHEVIDWNAYDEAEKELVWARLERLVVDVAGTRLSVFDADLLAQTLRAMGVRFHDDRTPLFGALELLRALGSQHVDTSRFGVTVLQDADTPGAVYRELNAEMLRRAEAWHDLMHGRARRFLARRATTNTPETGAPGGT